MSQIDPERLRGALNDHDAELLLLRDLVMALVDAHPNKQKVVASFQRQVEGYCNSAPLGTDPEYVIEVRARLQMYLQQLA